AQATPRSTPYVSLHAWRQFKLNMSRTGTMSPPSIMNKPKNKTDKKEEPRLIAENRRARYDYFIEERLEAGLVLQGWEVKSLRAGKAQIAEGYVYLKDGEAFLFGALVTPLNTTSTHVTADPKRTRKLLLNKSELSRLVGSVERKGYTL